MTTQSYDLAAAHIAALTGSADTVTDFRCLHDTNRAANGHSIRGVLREIWPALMSYQASGHGIFAVVSATDGTGVKIPNITGVRAHFADLDDIATAQQSLNAILSSPVPPQFIVQSSPGKYHAYWTTGPTAYLDQQRFDTIQRKLIVKYNGDDNARDMARVLRLSGTLHLKNPASPFLVTCQAGPGFGRHTAPEWLEAALSDIHVSETGSHDRFALGTRELAAPTFEFAVAALYGREPNELPFTEWISHMAAFRQAASLHADADTIKATFFKWCEQYDKNDPGENEKHWRTMDRGTGVGWPALRYSLPATATLGAPTVTPQPAYFSGTAAPDVPATPTPAAPIDPIITGPFLSPQECAVYFRSCYAVGKSGQIYDLKSNRYYNSTSFSLVYGGFEFGLGEKSTDDPWKAATRSTIWRVPVVDHTRFMPHKPTGEIIVNSRGRTGLNIYRPAVIRSIKGDAAPFINHIRRLLPHGQDAEILLYYMAHNVRFPGHKIPWAPVIQSTEGAGKNAIKLVMTYAMGEDFVYMPNALELTGGGSKFNGWMLERLMIIVDEVKTDEKRELVEILKPMVSEEQIEVQSKGKDQDKEDNYSNYIFFTNWKDAIPVSKNGRRFSIFYSVMQSADDLIKAGMDQTYFNNLYSWLKDGQGLAIVADYLLNYPIERGQLPMRAPDTTSMNEAIEQSRGPLEQLVVECMERKAPGFRGGWVSLPSLRNEAEKAGLKLRSDAPCQRVLEQMGYSKIGRAPRIYQSETVGAQTTSVLYHHDRTADVNTFGRLQGWE